jgi:predicted ATPase
LWARLSVFAGGFELDAAEGVCADDRLAAEEVLELLAALADKSVVAAEHGEVGGVRYQLPETLRQYGQERLQEFGEYTALRRRHRDWYEQLARHTDTDLLNPQIAEWVARLDRSYGQFGM